MRDDAAGKARARREGLQELRLLFLAEACNEIHELAALVAGDSRATRDPQQRCRKIAHDLRGAGGSYGYPAISSLAGTIEDALATEAFDRELGRLVAVLLETTERLLTAARDQTGPAAAALPAGGVPR